MGKKRRVLKEKSLTRKNLHAWQIAWVLREEEIEKKNHFLVATKRLKSLSVCLSVGLSICPSVHWFLSASVGSSVCWSIGPAVLNAYAFWPTRSNLCHVCSLPARQLTRVKWRFIPKIFVRLSVGLSVGLSVCVSVRVCLSVFVCPCLSVCLSVCSISYSCPVTEYWFRFDTENELNLIRKSNSCE